jgi:hypothetical protein
MATIITAFTPLTDSQWQKVIQFHITDRSARHKECRCARCGAIIGKLEPRIQFAQRDVNSNPLVKGFAHKSHLDF